jgi:hypothetical protein
MVQLSGDRPGEGRQGARHQADSIEADRRKTSGRACLYKIHEGQSEWQEKGSKELELSGFYGRSQDGLGGLGVRQAKVLN